MITLLINLLILVLIVGIIFYLIDLAVPAGGNLKQIAKIIVALIALLYLLAGTGIIAESGFHPLVIR